MIFYIPSFYGDIQLKRTAEGVALSWFKLTTREKAALETLRKKALDKGWADAAALASACILRAPIDKVAKVLARALKPDRELLTAVVFADGKIQRATEADFVEVVGTDAASEAAPAPAPAPVAATTVAQPARGCPEPDFVKAELRARTVLDAFLNSQQREDFRRCNRFITHGADTGRRYMITSRHALKGSRFVRSLHDLERDVPICTHDYSVPAAEEMLALHLCVSIPGIELDLLGNRA